MIRRILSLSILGSAALVCAQSPGGDGFDGPPVLRRALQNAAKLRYSGTRVVEFRRNGSTERHEETITRDGPFVRIEFPEGSPMYGQIIVENASDRRQYFPDKNEIYVLPPRRDEAYGRLSRMLAEGKGRINVTTSTGSEIAGIKTDLVVISDRPGNVMQRLYIDPESGLILKRELFDPVGAPFGGFEFKSVNFSPRINRRVFRIMVKGAKIVTPVDLLEDLAKDKGFLPVSLPTSSGYRLEASYVRNIQKADVLIENYSSSEGRHLTLFQLKTGVSPDRMRDFAKRDKVKAINWQAQGYTFVLVGNLDESALLKIARPLNGGN